MRVLLIDDNEEIRDAVSFYLDSQGIECHLVGDGHEGLTEIRNSGDHFFNVILLDLAMPDFSGFQVFEKLKEEGLLKTNNVVLFTASNLNPQQLQKMVADGAKGILNKPMSIEELEDAIKKFQ